MPKRRKKKRDYVIDSYCLLVYLQKQNGWQEMGTLLRMWKRQRRFAKLNWVNWGEIYYIVRARYGHGKATETMELLAGLPIELEAVDFELVRSAAELKSDFGFSYGDGFCAATALRLGAILVTGDPELKPLERLLDIRWI